MRTDTFSKNGLPELRTLCAWTIPASVSLQSSVRATLLAGEKV